MKNTDIQNKWDELFDENIENGLSFKVPRRSGKSTWIITKALKLVLEGKSVAIVCDDYNRTNEMRKLIKEVTHGILINDAIPCYCKDTRWISFIKYKFYDECDGLNRPNTCSIFTEQKNIFTFGSDWLSMEVKNRMRSIGTKEFKTQFESNIVTNGHVLEVKISLLDIAKNVFGENSVITSTDLYTNMENSSKKEFTIKGYYND